MDAEGPAPGRFVYETPWPAYALAWSMDPKPGRRLAVGSCIEHDSNKIQVIEHCEETNMLEPKATVEHALAPTKLMWRPAGTDGSGSDLLASASTTLQVWKLEEGRLRLAAKMANTRTQQGCAGHLAPVTSFDWSGANPHKIGASSVDTTCTLWNLETSKIETQLIAHDKAVYDIAFASHDAHFGSVGADGSMRLFDQRNLDHSTIIFETSPPSPLLRLVWNKLNQNHIATIAMDSPGVLLIDIRRPYTAVAKLSHRCACVNSVCWAPHSRNHLLVGGSDGCAVIWDVDEASSKTPVTPVTPPPQQRAQGEKPPLLAHDCGREVYQVQWPAARPDFVALGTAEQVSVLQV